MVVLAVSGLVVSRLHKIFGSQDLNANAGAGIEIVQFNPKVVVYEVFGSPGATANINYWDADANTHQINAAPLPWSITISTTLPSVSANIMAQSDGNQIGCRITVDGIVREEQELRRRQRPDLLPGEVRMSDLNTSSRERRRHRRRSGCERAETTERRRRPSSRTPSAFSRCRSSWPGWW